MVPNLVDLHLGLFLQRDTERMQEAAFSCHARLEYLVLPHPLNETSASLTALAPSLVEKLANRLCNLKWPAIDDEPTSRLLAPTQLVSLPSEHLN